MSRVWGATSASARSQCSRLYHNSARSSGWRRWTRQRQQLAAHILGRTRQEPPGRDLRGPIIQVGDVADRETDPRFLGRAVPHHVARQRGHARRERLQVRRLGERDYAAKLVEQERIGIAHAGGGTQAQETAVGALPAELFDGVTERPAGHGEVGRPQRRHRRGGIGPRESLERHPGDAVRRCDHRHTSERTDILANEHPHDHPKDTPAVARMGLLASAPPAPTAAPSGRVRLLNYREANSAPRGADGMTDERGRGWRVLVFGLLLGASIVMGGLARPGGAAAGAANGPQSRRRPGRRPATAGRPRRRCGARGSATRARPGGVAHFLARRLDATDWPTRESARQPRLLGWYADAILVEGDRRGRESRRLHALLAEVLISRRELLAPPDPNPRGVRSLTGPTLDLVGLADHTGARLRRTLREELAGPCAAGDAAAVALLPLVAGLLLLLDCAWLDALAAISAARRTDFRPRERVLRCPSALAADADDPARDRAIVLGADTELAPHALCRQGGHADGVWGVRTSSDTVAAKPSVADFPSSCGHPRRLPSVSYDRPW